MSKTPTKASLRFHSIIETYPLLADTEDALEIAVSRHH
jgi:hypothetical protein